MIDKTWYSQSPNSSSKGSGEGPALLGQPCVPVVGSPSSKNEAKSNGCISNFDRPSNNAVSSSCDDSAKQNCSVTAVQLPTPEIELTARAAVPDQTTVTAALLGNGTAGGDNNESSSSCVAVVTSTATAAVTVHSKHITTTAAPPSPASVEGSNSCQAVIASPVNTIQTAGASDELGISSPRNTKITVDVVVDLKGIRLCDHH